MLVVASPPAPAVSPKFLGDASSEARLDALERVHEVLRASDNLEGILCIKSRQGVLVAVAYLDLPRTVDQLNGLMSRTMEHYTNNVRSFANDTVRAAGALMADGMGQVGTGATQLVNGGIKTAWGWGTWPARKTLALMIAPLYAFADPNAVPSLLSFQTTARMGRAA